MATDKQRAAGGRPRASSGDGTALAVNSSRSGGPGQPGMVLLDVIRHEHADVCELVPADDDEPITEEFIRAWGIWGAGPHAGTALWANQYATSIYLRVDSGDVYATDRAGNAAKLLAHFTTRGQLRRLVAALTPKAKDGE